MDELYSAQRADKSKEICEQLDEYFKVVACDVGPKGVIVVSDSLIREIGRWKNSAINHLNEYETELE